MHIAMFECICLNVTYVANDYVAILSIYTIATSIRSNHIVYIYRLSHN